MRQMGYEVKYGIMNAASFRTAQTRQRVFVLASRGVPLPIWPTPTHLARVRNVDKLSTGLCIPGINPAGRGVPPAISIAGALEGLPGPSSPGYARRRRPGQKLSPLDHAGYRMQERRGEFNIVVRCGKLYQEWLVDQDAKVESERLSFLRGNQPQLRADQYQNCVANRRRQAPGGGAPELLPGRRVILPFSFNGGPRQMRELYQDAMAIVREYGTPDLFVTLTTSTKGPEITAALWPGEQASDRPDVVNTVFDTKLRALKKLLFKDGILGRVVAHSSTIEFQKRRLPHCHMLLILGQEDKLRTPEVIDRCPLWIYL